MPKRGAYKPRLMFFLDDLMEARKGKIYLLGSTSYRKGPLVVYDCQCECGNRMLMTTQDIQKNNDCGCGGNKKGCFITINGGLI